MPSSRAASPSCTAHPIHPWQSAREGWPSSSSPAPPAPSIASLQAGILLCSIPWLGEALPHATWAARGAGALCQAPFGWEPGWRLSDPKLIPKSWRYVSGAPSSAVLEHRARTRSWQGCGFIGQVQVLVCASVSPLHSGHRPHFGRLPPPGHRLGGGRRDATEGLRGWGAPGGLGGPRWRPGSITRAGGGVPGGRGGAP